MESVIVTGACFLITVIFIGIGIELPWAFLPATGMASMVIGYNWGFSDLRSSKGRRQTKKKRLYCQAMASGYAGSPDINGDSYCSTHLPDGRFIIALSDGMGKGEQAAEESSLVVKSVTRMLKAGLEPEVTLKLLNTIFMVHGGKECYSTMDLALLDPDTRELTIYKIGAAPTVIRRTAGRSRQNRDRIRKNPAMREKYIETEILAAPAMPMGVMEYDRIPCVSTMVHPGDMIIMISDGIVDSVREDLELKWLQEFMTGIRSADAQTVSDLIIREAASNYGFREKDDMTVVSFVVR